MDNTAQHKDVQPEGVLPNGMMPQGAVPVGQPVVPPVWAQRVLPAVPARRGIGEWLLRLTAIGISIGGLLLVGFFMLAQVFMAPGVGVWSLLFVALEIFLLGLVCWFFPGFRPKLAFYALIWGAAGSMLLVTAGGDAWMRITSSLGMQWAQMSFAGAYPEEIAKGAGVVMLLWLYGKRPWEGMLYGMWVGLGFEVFENYLYGISAALYDANSDLHGMWYSWALRTVAGPWLHVLFVGFVGLGIGEVMFGTRSRWWLALLGFVGHFVWNLQFDTMSWHFVSMGAVMVLLYPWFVVLFVRSWKRARADIAEEYVPVFFKL